MLVGPACVVTLLILYIAYLYSRICHLQQDVQDEKEKRKRLNDDYEEEIKRHQKHCRDLRDRYDEILCSIDTNGYDRYLRWASSPDMTPEQAMLALSNAITKLKDSYHHEKLDSMRLIKAECGEKDITIQAKDDQIFELNNKLLELQHILLTNKYMQQANFLTSSGDK